MCSPGLVWLVAPRRPGRALCGVSAVRGLPCPVELGLGLFFEKLTEVVVLLPPTGLSSQFAFQNREGLTAACLPVSRLLVGVLRTFRLGQSCTSRLYGRHKEKLAKTLAALTWGKCQLISKIGTAEKENAGVGTSAENARLKRDSLNILSLADT